jgi:hypothetical protein
MSDNGKLTDAQLSALAQGRRIGSSLGGRAIKSKVPPASCPRCGADTAGRTWHSFLGHLGLHGLADRYFDGDIEAAQRHLRKNGLARQDPAPGNGAFRPYTPVNALAATEVVG